MRRTALRYGVYRGMTWDGVYCIIWKRDSVFGALV